MAKLVKLADQSGAFYDKDLGWAISGADAKELPEAIPPGSLTAQWLNSGGLVHVDDEPNPDQAPAEEAAEEAIEEPQPEPEHAVEPESEHEQPAPAPKRGRKPKAKK